MLHFTRFVEGLGLGGATMLAPTYVAENSPRAIRGLLIGFYQLFETMGAMIAFFIDYGSLLHSPVRLYHLASENLGWLLTPEFSFTRAMVRGWYH
jgi:MFS family permease